jgi:hypothetical protein
MGPTAASTITLCLLSPKGIWRPPLTPEQIQSALMFGRNHLANVNEINEDPYDFRLPSLKVFISVGTAFSRIAAYAGQCARTGAEPDMAFVEGVVFGSSLQDSIMLRVISPHKIVSVVHIENGVQHNMENVTRERREDLWVETCTFPYPRDVTAPQRFEVFVPSTLLLWGKKADLTVPFDILH